MVSPLRRVARFILVLAVLLSGFGPTPPAPSATPASPVTTGEVRLRKLHLVRPDLIRYPMALDVYC